MTELLDSTLDTAGVGRPRRDRDEPRLVDQDLADAPPPEHWPRATGTWPGARAPDDPPRTYTSSSCSRAVRR